ncbi:Chloride intracellular channel protein 5 [Galemys pyrenaicus]|uniref:Chloride intracellular channel protein 5 n=1 Tax=Galemys pyrenaicus TaxID=202257 RepID=A0A8J6A0B5_GALPY|nr:Chloride intracellular channel protein 5 [Galemys pyrenaicus]
MNEGEYSNIYDTIQQEGMYELPDQPEENEVALYDDVHQDLDSESNLYATAQETHQYDSLSACVVEGEENNLTPTQPEYDLPYEACPQDPQDLQTGEPQEELYVTPEDQEPNSEEPQENGSRMKEDPISLSCFIMQESRASSTLSDSPACYSAANDVKENEPASVNPEISLYVKPLTHQASGDSMSSLEKSKSSELYYWK